MMLVEDPGKILAVASQPLAGAASHIFDVG